MKKVTAFGEILFDVYPEVKTLGGAPFNFIYHIKKLTGEGNFISKVGDDELGKEIFNFLELNGISSDYIAVDKEHSTGVANANLDENKIPHWEIKLNCAYDFIEPSDKITNLIEDGTDCLYFGTLAQRNNASRNTLNKMFGKKIKYFCDLNFRQNYYDADIIKTSLNTADILKLNDDELKIVNQLLLKQTYDEMALAKHISEKFNIELVCITLGSKGAILYKNGRTDHYMADAEIIVDTVGAGDAYASVLCLGYLNGWEISKINRIASEFAAEIVQVKGALPRKKSIYERFIETIRS
ncbi:MAG: PfkB family carbohydrate kinase [Ignavibacteriaceae bacterium]|nr:PfkB family carbohydrate kinase [Ignavibacteriaceae bacterium]